MGTVHLTLYWAMFLSPRPITKEMVRKQKPYLVWKQGQSIKMDNG